VNCLIVKIMHCFLRHSHLFLDIHFNSISSEDTRFIKLTSSQLTLVSKEFIFEFTSVKPFLAVSIA
jgi:hypothetical protein